MSRGVPSSLERLEMRNNALSAERELFAQPHAGAETQLTALFRVAPYSPEDSATGSQYTMIPFSSEASDSRVLLLGDVVEARSNVVPLHTGRRKLSESNESKYNRQLQSTGRLGLSRVHERLSQLRLDEAGAVDRAAISVLGSILLVSGLATAGLLWGARPDEADEASERRTLKPIAEIDSTDCERTWKLSEAVPNEQHRWNEDEKDPISMALKSARSQAEGKAAVLDMWVPERKLYAEQVATWVNTSLNFTEDESLTADAFIGEDGCMSEEGAKWIEEVEALHNDEGTVYLPGIVPPSFHNTGMDADGQIVTSEGVGGDNESRRGVLVKLVNGVQYWVLARCEQIATKNPIARLLKGKTDNEKPACTNCGKKGCQRDCKPDNKCKVDCVKDECDERTEICEVKTGLGSPAGGGNAAVPADRDHDAGGFGGTNNLADIAPGISQRAAQIRQEQEETQVDDGDDTQAESDDSGASTGNTNQTYEIPSKNTDIPKVNEDKGSVQLP